jgi:hypothetical protein
MRPRFVRPVLAIATALALCAVLAPAASAGEYSDNKGHYHFSYPDTWNAAAVAGSDAAYNGTTVNGVAPTVAADHSKENQAADTTDWVLAYAQAAFTQVNGSVTATEVQAPRTFTTGGGRIAADFVYEYNGSGGVIRERQVFFASAALNTAVTLELSDNATTYDSHASEWASIVDSLAFDGEPEIPADLAITIDGGNNTTVAPNATVRFALNQTISNGLVVEWFRNGTPVANASHVDLTLPPGLAVISVKISNATANRTLSTTIAAGNATTNSPPPPGTTDTGAGSLLLPLLVAVIAVAAVAGIYLFVIRPKRSKPASPSQGAPPASTSSPPGPPKNE